MTSASETNRGAFRVVRRHLSFVALELQACSAEVSGDGLVGHVGLEYVGSAVSLHAQLFAGSVVEVPLELLVPRARERHNGHDVSGVHLVSFVGLESSLDVLAHADFDAGFGVPEYVYAAWHGVLLSGRAEPAENCIP